MSREDLADGIFAGRLSHNAESGTCLRSTEVVSTHLAILRSWQMACCCSLFRKTQICLQLYIKEKFQTEVKETKRQFH